MLIINVPFIEFCGLLNVSCGFQYDMRSCVIRGLDLGGVQTSHRIRFLKFMLLYFHFSFLCSCSECVKVINVALLI